jgi:diguanylate cyclase (GGDEF)-like protein
MEYDIFLFLPCAILEPVSARDFIEGRSKWFWGIVGCVLVALVGIADYFTGLELNLTLFYVIPISLVAWYAGGRLGLIASAASAVVGFLIDLAGGMVYSHPTIFVWNTLIRFGLFTAISILLSIIRKEYKNNQEQARVDYVTGAVSIRYFYDLAKLEIIRFQRYKRPFTFAYIDLDNFKRINDSLGHSAGDRLLRSVVSSIQQHIRPVDIFARLGGDEFGLFLYETGEEEAKTVISRIHKGLVNDMLKNSWMMTFSIGVVTFRRVPKSVDEMVKQADGVMYTVKSTTKNGVRYHTYMG